MQDIKLLLAAVALARIIAGETSGCPIAAKVGVAQVAVNRNTAGIVGGWYGDADPEAVDQVIAWLAITGKLASDGSAIYAIGPGDKPRMPWLAGKSPSHHWNCAAGDFVELYTGK